MGGVRVSLGESWLQVVPSCWQTFLHYVCDGHGRTEVLHLQVLHSHLASKHAGCLLTHCGHWLLLQVLHYQWFADFGNVDAARAVAHMLTHGSLRDYEQAIYYLK